ncbi:MAG: hypothetical protein U1D70_08195 [Methylobacter sp.]|nr:hypothetical protein [Methylobacter sp.]MDP2430285.1 hypothetical protein [Methylobacter sp.]MDP3056285.1 hypothetical protein [Methylobacter sp.]MDP3361041.1 hypothetical protein [Methylobacter sp.]MDZ4218989.1 hypothetical protein [Methylobacter sp.]
MTDDELKALVASLAVDSKNLHEAQKATDEQMKATDEKIASLAVAQQETTRKLDKLGELYGNVGQNQGDVAEEFFLNSLLKDNHLGSIHFDDVVKNMEKHRGQIQEEYDLVMTNGDAIGIVEVKYKAYENDLDKLDRKMKNFKKLFPIYQNYKQYGAIASFQINDKAKKEALRRGYFVLQRSGDLVHTESGDHLTVL